MRSSCRSVTPLALSAHAPSAMQSAGNGLLIWPQSVPMMIDGEPIQEVAAGGAVRIEPGERHWHGATPDSPMTHLGVQPERERPDQLLHHEAYAAFALLVDKP
jgi:hypothetical protein